MDNTLQLVVLFWNLARKYAKSYADSLVGGVTGGLHWRGAVNYYSGLPTDADEGDCYTVKYLGSSGTKVDGTEYAWGTLDGKAQWIPIGPDISNKADKVSGATAGHLAALDADGNLTDSGKTAVTVSVNGNTLKIDQ